MLVDMLNDRKLEVSLSRCTVSRSCHSAYFARTLTTSYFSTGFLQNRCTSLAFAKTRGFEPGERYPVLDVNHTQLHVDS